MHLKFKDRLKSKKLKKKENSEQTKLESTRKTQLDF